MRYAFSRGWGPIIPMKGCLTVQQRSAVKRSRFRTNLLGWYVFAEIEPVLGRLPLH